MPERESAPVGEGRQPPSRALRALLGRVLELLQLRLELLGVEAQEALQRLVALLAWLVVAVVGLGVGVVLVALWLTVLLWDSHRLLALTALATLFVAAGVLAVWQIRRLLWGLPRPFAASVAELQADRLRWLGGAGGSAQAAAPSESRGAGFAPAAASAAAAPTPPAGPAP